MMRCTLQWWGKPSFVKLETPKPDIYLTSRIVTRGGRRGAKPLLEKFSPPLEKCVGHSLKLLETAKKIRAPLRKLFAPPWCPKLVTGLLTSCYVALVYG